jgi:hypothetical protein
MGPSFVQANVTALANFCLASGVNLKTTIACGRCNATLLPGMKFCMTCSEAIARSAS